MGIGSLNISAHAQFPKEESTHNREKGLYAVKAIQWHCNSEVEIFQRMLTSLKKKIRIKRKNGL